MAEYQALLDNKKEYIEHLYEIIIPSIIQEFQNIYLKGNKSNALQDFQNNLIKISTWNEDEVNEFYNKLMKKSECNYFKDLLKGILVTLLKIYVIQDSTKKNIKLHIPNPRHFVHECLKNCARNTWKKPHLFYHEVRSIERQHNLSIAEEIYMKSINSTIRKALPMHDIFTSIDNEDVEIIDDDKQDVTQEDNVEDTDDDSEDISLNESDNEDKDKDLEPEPEQESKPKPKQVISLENLTINKTINDKKEDEDEDKETEEDKDEDEDEETEEDKEDDEETEEDKEDDEETEEDTDEDTEEDTDDDSDEDKDTDEDKEEKETVINEGTKIINDIDIGITEDIRIKSIRESYSDPTRKNIIIIEKPTKHSQITSKTKVVKKALDDAFF